MSNVKALTMLAGVRKRQGDRIKDELQQQRSLLLQLHDKVDKAKEAFDRLSLEESKLQDELLRILREGFTPERRISLDYALKDAAAVKQQAAAAVLLAKQALPKQEAVIQGLESSLRRNQQRIDSLHEQIKTIKMQQEQAIEDAAEEEAEETSSARFCRNQRSPVAY